MNDMFPFEVKYSFEKKPNGLIVIDTPKHDTHEYTIRFIAKGPDFDLVATILEEATFINHITGAPFIRTSTLYREIFKNAIIQVDFIDNPELKNFRINDSYNLVKIISKKWLQEVM